MGSDKLDTGVILGSFRKHLLQDMISGLWSRLTSQREHANNMALSIGLSAERTFASYRKPPPRTSHRNISEYFKWGILSGILLGTSQAKAKAEGITRKGHQNGVDTLRTFASDPLDENLVDLTGVVLTWSI
ncbi:hypothetical protein M569_03944 [Genlisea aurea]|uniref:Uncharacterized protein n=1 Tax=Genlisea aurea TaxID=192259 RepID=S8CVH3_9LAMI|nr:hypothetical protein M569_03944 [Genlisea aurea]